MHEEILRYRGERRTVRVALRAQSSPCTPPTRYTDGTNRTCSSAASANSTSATSTSPATTVGSHVDVTTRHPMMLNCNKCASAMSTSHVPYLAWPVRDGAWVQCISRRWRVLSPVQFGISSVFLFFVCFSCPDLSS